MKTLYLECRMGASGDMLMSALCDLLPDPENFVNDFCKLNIPGISLTKECRIFSGIRGTRIQIQVHDNTKISEDIPTVSRIRDTELPSHQNISDKWIGLQKIYQIINTLNTTETVKQNTCQIYNLIAEAESYVHGNTTAAVHFHEADTMDTISNIVGVCLLINRLHPQQIICSPVHVGTGMVRCTQGVMPVPTPTTAQLLQGIPCYGSSIEGELCTSTGAAILKYFSNTFSHMPVMTTEKIGYGFGTKEFSNANILRAFWGESPGESRELEELSCNVDDSTGEELGYAMETLLKNGALEVFLTPIQMKKSRPGIILTVITTPFDAEKMIQLILQHTTTLGIRRRNCSTVTLQRYIETRKTPLGTIHYKVASGHGIYREKAEYNDLVRIAQTNHLSLREVLQKLSK